MMQRNDLVPATIRFDDDQATIVRHDARHEVHTARVLGSYSGELGTHWYLDRLVHAPWEQQLGQYGCGGCLTTILTLPEAAASSR